MRIKYDLDLDSAIDWLIDSGIQSANGGFYAWYDYKKESYSFLYPETTGYAIELLLKLWKTRRKNLFLRRAIEAGNWLVKIQREDGAFHCKYFNEVPFESSKDCDKSLYTFDAGICLSGLLDLYEVTSDVKYLDSSLKTADWLLKLQRSDGSFIAGYDPKGNVIENHHWSRTNGCHHLKNTLALLRLHKITKEAKYLDSAEKLLKWGLKLQVDSGRFVTFPGSEETYSHAHCYAIEGLLFSSKLLNNITNITPSERAIYAARWLSGVQNPDGSIWNWYTSNREKIKVSDALAQAVGIWVIIRELLSEQEEIRKFSMNIEKGLSFLSNAQCLSGDKRSHGGFYYGEKIEHINTCATLFALRIPFLLKWVGNVSCMIDTLF